MGSSSRCIEAGELCVSSHPAAAIEFDRVTKQFGDVTAVADASFCVHFGEICVLIGPSGCGKTTTLKMINRVIEPTEGSIRVRGRDIRSVDPVQLRRSIGYVIQHVGLFPHMSIANNIAVPLRLKGIPSRERRQRAANLLDLVRLDRSLLDRRPSELSGGQQQRVGVARALAAEPDMILMDEPFGAVDPVLRQQLQRELKEIQQTVRKTIVLVTHDLGEAFTLADRLVVMERGRVVQQGTPRELMLTPHSGFVRQFLADASVSDVLCLTQLRDLVHERAATKDQGPQLPEDMSLLSAMEALAGASAANQRVEAITLIDAGGKPVGSLHASEFLLAVARVLGKKG
jgi:osmoprotectant transport system ATP-binding protein